MKKKIILGISILVIIIIAGILVFNLIKSPATPGKIKIGYQPLTVNAALYAAIEQGYFSKNNVEVEMVRFETTDQIVNALITGQIDMSGIIAYYPLLSVETQTADRFKIFAANQQNDSEHIDFLIVSSDPSIIQYNNLSDLANKKIGIFPGSSTRAIVKVMLKSDPGLIDKVTIIEIPGANQVAALKAKQVDALITLEPFATIAVVNGAGKIAVKSPFSKYVLNNFTLGAAAISQSFNTKKKALCSRAIESFYMGIDFLRTNGSEARKYLAKYTPIQGTVVDQVNLGNTLKINELDINSMQKLVSIYKDEGELVTEVDVRKMLIK